MLCIIRKLLFLGNLHELGQNPHRSLAHLARIHGPVMSLKIGSIHTIVISSPRCAKEVLKTKEHSISNRQVPDVVQSLGHHEVSIVWSSQNQSRRYLRTLVKTHLFNTHSLDPTQLLRRRKIHELVAYIRGKNGEAVHIALAAFSTVLNLISTTFLSIDMIDLKSESAQELKDLIWGLMEETGRPNLSDFFPSLAPMDIQGRRRRSTVYYNKLYELFDKMGTLRLHPPVPLLLPHKVGVSTEINGYLAPKNSQVLMNIWAISRDERVWENQNCFVPERFLGEREIDFRGQHFEFIPFYSGRRICLGLLFGVRIVQLMLASLIQSFEWSLPDGIMPKNLDLKEKFRITLTLASPLKAMATPAR
ncbi:hypothetical protein IEQ34_006316 [Dendrobium chrysotoxum]|uniref:Cytochrome P450 n=1 Tax=Dendrobium chrysotoxum TaxID=161865 RepID=A0AAV7HDT7_DENCH|nr:hypothetical protein IEQ34_006316 [Dendrobium chrysotoxum]